VNSAFSHRRRDDGFQNMTIPSQGDGPSGKTSPIVLIGVAGPSASGKTVLVEQVVGLLGQATTLISLDDYYRDLGHLPAHERDAVNFDELEALEIDLLTRHLRSLRSGNSIRVPSYDFVEHVRSGTGTIVASSGVVFVEGVFVLADPDLRTEFDFSIFIDAPAGERLRRRIDRDVAHRGWSVEQVRHHWQERVVPAEERLIYASQTFADIVINNVDSPTEAAERMAKAVADRIAERYRSGPESQPSITTIS
jgi:uridine kinase